MTTHQPVPIHHTRGQALSEMLLVLMVLLPLWWIIPMLDKYQQMSHATLLASRYAAWDAAWFAQADASRAKPPSQSENELEARLFSDPWQAIRSIGADSVTQAQPHPGWRNPDGHPLLHPVGPVLQMSQKALPMPLLAQAGLASPHAMGLASAQLTMAKVTVDVSNLPTGRPHFQPFDTLDLQLQSTTALMHDGWTARSSAQAEAQMARMTPIDGVSSSAMAGVLNVTMPLVELDGVRPPKLMHLPLWRDLVPADRLQEAAP